MISNNFFPNVYSMIQKASSFNHFMQVSFRDLQSANYNHFHQVEYHTFRKDWPWNAIYIIIH